MSTPVTIESDDEGEEIFPEEVFFDDDYTEVTSPDELYELELLQSLGFTEDAEGPDVSSEPDGYR